MMKLYTHPLSTYARRVHVALLEKGIEVEEVVVNMPKAEHRSDTYKAMNPYGRVPVLVDGDFVLYESSAILTYIEGQRPTPPLVPTRDAQELALVDMHMRLCDTEMAANVGTIIFPKRFIPEEKWRKDEMAAASKKIQRHLDILEKQLEGKTYLVAEAFSLADICYLPFVAFMPMLDVEAGPNVAAWTVRLLNRDSAVKTAPADGPEKQ